MSINNEILEKHGLKLDEYKKIQKLLTRNPNLLELGIFPQCGMSIVLTSLQNSLEKFTYKGKQVIQGPGENAGVIDIGDDDAIVFKIESHNHPSYIEPYQGAATAGGILRDVFTMGARPIALLNSIHFDHYKNENFIKWRCIWDRRLRNCIEFPQYW